MLKSPYRKDKSTFNGSHLWTPVRRKKNIEKFCDENNLALIEDSAEAHGQYVDNQIVDLLGLFRHLVFMQINMLQLVKEELF